MRASTKLFAYGSGRLYLSVYMWIVVKNLQHLSGEVLVYGHSLFSEQKSKVFIGVSQVTLT